MPIELDTPSAARTAVVRRTRLGEVFVGALIKTEQRQIIKTENGVSVPQVKPDGRPRNELVVHLVTMPGTTMPAGLGDTVTVPEPGTIVRAILKGGGYGDWIEADNALKPRQVGDTVLMSSDYGVAYDPNTFRPVGDRITDQAALDAIPRGRSVGIYGQLAIRRTAPEQAAWVTKAEEAYMAADRVELPEPTVNPADVFAGVGQAPAPQTPATAAPVPQPVTAPPTTPASAPVDPFAGLGQTA